MSCQSFSFHYPITLFFHLCTSAFFKERVAVSDSILPFLHIILDCILHYEVMHYSRLLLPNSLNSPHSLCFHSFNEQNLPFLLADKMGSKMTTCVATDISSPLFPFCNCIKNTGMLWLFLNISTDS